MSAKLKVDVSSLKFASTLKEVLDAKVKAAHNRVITSTTQLESAKILMNV